MNSIDAVSLVDVADTRAADAERGSALGGKNQRLAKRRRRHWGLAWLQYLSNLNTERSHSAGHIVCTCLHRNLDGELMYDCTCAAAI